MDLVVFFFVLLGSKLLMGAVAIYMLIPRDVRCVLCDAETLPVEHARAYDWLLRVLRLQRRWCMECRNECVGRRQPLRAVTRRASLPVPERRLG